MGAIPTELTGDSIGPSLVAALDLGEYLVCRLAKVKLMITKYAPDILLICDALLIYTDIDECSDNSDGCSQICTNTGGSFTCSCRDGYILSSNRKTCLGEPNLIASCTNEWHQ